MFTKKLLAALCLFSTAGALAVLRADEPVVRFHTSLGDIDVILDTANAPNTVTNFLGYVSRGNYTNSIFHRLVPEFVLQGGGYYVVYDSTGKGKLTTIPTQAPVASEYKDSNTRGTIAMALYGSDANSATDQWFFNLVDNSKQLNSQAGGFTVFGYIINNQGLAVMDALAALNVIDAGSPLDQLPVIDNADANDVQITDLVYVNAVTVQPAAAFFTGETALSNGVYYLAFPDGNPLGYFAYFSDPHYIYHYDMGYEYTIDAGDGKAGVYLYDFKSSTFFYTNPADFPFLYDFSLNTFLYYYPDPNNPGHYNTNGTRYFYDFATQAVIVK